MVSWVWKSSELKNLNILHEFNSDQTRHTGCLKIRVLPNWAFGDPADSWEEILMIFVANLQIFNSVKLSILDTLHCIKKCIYNPGCQFANYI